MSEIDLSPIVPVAVDLMAAILLAVGSWALARLARWLRLKGDDEVRVYLDTALLNGIELAKRRLKERGKNLTMATKREALAHATGYVIAQVPGALKRLKVDPAAVERAIEARLPELPSR